MAVFLVLCSMIPSMGYAAETYNITFSKTNATSSIIAANIYNEEIKFTDTSFSFKDKSTTTTYVATVEIDDTVTLTTTENVISKQQNTLLDTEKLSNKAQFKKGVAINLNTLGAYLVSEKQLTDAGVSFSSESAAQAGLVKGCMLTSNKMCD